MADEGARCEPSDPADAEALPCEPSDLSNAEALPCEPSDLSNAEALPCEPFPHIALFCVGNRLMLDDGVGPAVYDELVATYDFPDNIELYDVGCMSLDMIPVVESSDYLITVDALDDTETDPGTVLTFTVDDMARSRGAAASLHELTLADLIDAAALLGYHAQGRCLGMQVENASPVGCTVGLTPRVSAALPSLVDAVLAELVRCGVDVRVKQTGEAVEAGWHHVPAQQEIA